jgi:hypothetical protein
LAIHLPEMPIPRRQTCAKAVLALAAVVLFCHRAQSQYEPVFEPQKSSSHIPAEFYTQLQNPSAAEPAPEPASAPGPALGAAANPEPGLAPVPGPSFAAGLASGPPPSPVAVGAWEGYEDFGLKFLCEPPGPEYWTLDYRCRAFCSSFTAYEFGTPPDMTPSYSPLSRLKFSLNSCWHGLMLAKETPTWGVQFEWLMAGQYIQGDLEDYDWRYSDRDSTDLGYMRERWTEGQMLDFTYKFRLFDRPFHLPCGVWPIVGFRWQRLDVVAYDLEQVKYDNVWLDPPYTNSSDIITLNQQYYIGYGGGQLRGEFQWRFLPPIVWTLQGDWGYTQAYNIDHHLIREGDRYTMERTHGDCWHVALTVEALVTNRFALGVQVDHLQISTTGTHHFLNDPYDIDETWDNGVKVWSMQTWITGFLRFRY